MPNRCPRPTCGGNLIREEEDGGLWDRCLLCCRATFVGYTTKRMLRGRCCMDCGAIFSSDPILAEHRRKAHRRAG